MKLTQTGQTCLNTESGRVFAKDFTDILQTYVLDFYDTLKSFTKLTPDRPNMLKHRIWESIRKMSYGILTIFLYSCGPLLRERS
jgi:hypothetical protein